MQFLVLGMHRSGTSAITRLIGLGGAWYGTPDSLTAANEENPTGFWERRDVRSVCDGILHAHGLDWWKVSGATAGWLDPQLAAPYVVDFAAIVDELDQHAPWVIKEPRLCLVASALLGTLTHPTFIHVTRDPLEVADSLRRRNGFPLAVGVALWEKYTREAARSSSGRPRVHVRYGELIADPVATVSALVSNLEAAGAIGLAVPDAAAIHGFVDGELHRQRRPPTDGLGVLNAGQQALADAVATGSYLDGTFDDSELSEGATDVLAAFEHERAEISRLEGALDVAVSEVTDLAAQVARSVEQIDRLSDDARLRQAADRKRIRTLVAAEALQAERADAAETAMDRLGAEHDEMRSDVVDSLAEVEGRLHGVSASRPWRAVRRAQRAARALRRSERFDLDHLQKATRDLATLRARIDHSDRGRAGASRGWASVETLPSGRQLRHTVAPDVGGSATGRSGRSKLAVIAWDVGHNPLGRAYTLAAAMADEYDVEIWGAQFPRYGSRPWQPLRHSPIPLHVFDGLELPDHAEAMAEIAERIDADVVWVSKPRLPSFALGALTKQLRNRPLILDVDDHELAFFQTDEARALDEVGSLPLEETVAPFGRAWTQVCDTLIDAADLVTVSNVALQRKYGGVVVPHIRDGRVFDPGRFDRQRVRAELGVAPDQRLLLFGGTPRLHKGVREILDALDALDDPRYRLALFQTPELSEIGDLGGSERWIVPIPPQPFDRLPGIVGAADLSCVLQDPEHPVVRFQLPAKITDALAMGTPCLVRAVPPLQPLVDAGVVAVHPTDEPLHETLTRLFDDPVAFAQFAERGRRYYDEHLTFSAVTSQLSPLIEAMLAEPPPLDARLGDMVAAAAHVGAEHPAPAPTMVPVPVPAPARRAPGTRRRDATPGETYDLVMFWKQNDTGLYGRRSDMLLEHLERSGRFGTIVHFDRLISPQQLRTMWRASSGANDQRRLVARATVARLLHRRDHGGIVARTFLYSARSKRRFGLPRRSAYPDYVRRVLAEHGVGTRLTIFWVWPTNQEFPAIVDALQPDLVVADVVDDNRTWYAPGDPKLAEIEGNYREVLERSDLVIANCEPVVASMRELGFGASLIANGCELPDGRPRGPRPASLDLPAGPIIGYVGNLSSRIDIDLLDHLAHRRPDWQFALIGSTHLDTSILRLDEHANVHFLGVRPYREAKAMIPHFDVAIIPHVDNAMTRSMNPLKAFVYAAAGVPIVSTPVANLSELDELITIAAGADEFEAAIEAALTQPRGAPRVDLLEPHSWDRRVADVLTLIDRVAGAASSSPTSADA